MTPVDSDTSVSKSVLHSNLEFPSLRNRRESHFCGIATQELRYGDAGDANRARDDSDLTVRRGVLFGITSNTLVRFSQSSSGPAGGASDGCGLGRGAAVPDRWCLTTAAGAL